VQGQGYSVAVLHLTMPILCETVVGVRESMINYWCVAVQMGIAFCSAVSPPTFTRSLLFTSVFYVIAILISNSQGSTAHG
jgi:hypothetical protein